MGVLAVAVTAVLGLLTAQSRRVSEVADAQAAGRLGAGIGQELERLKMSLGLDGLAAFIPSAGANLPLQLTATRDGRRILRCDGPGAAADRPLNDGVLSGIAWRDRYFLAEVSQQPDLPFAPGAGYLAVTARVSWPHRLPAGPADPAASEPAEDPSRLVPPEERNALTFNLVLRP